MIKDLCFEIIQKCPNECIFCSSCANINKNNIITFDTFKMVIDHLIDEGGIEELSISGGEPFLNPDLFKMIKYAKNKNIRVVLFTSGVKKNNVTNEEISLLPNSYLKEMISKKTFTSISKEEMNELKRIGLDKIVFDFQGNCPYEYKLLMGKNNFCEASTSIIRASLSGLETDIHFIPMKLNYKSLPEIIELLNIAGVKNLSLLNFVPQGRGKQNEDKLKMTKEDYIEFKRILEKSKEEFNGNIRIGIPLNGNTEHKCTAGLSKLVIKYDGTILPCPAFKEFDHETLRKNGFRVLNIYENLDELKIHEGTRNYPLCKKLYNFEGGNL